MSLYNKNIRKNIQDAYLFNEFEKLNDIIYWLEKIFMTYCNQSSLLQCIEYILRLMRSYSNYKSDNNILTVTQNSKNASIGTIEH